MAKITVSGFISQRHGSADPDPDPHQNVMDPQGCKIVSVLCHDDADSVCGNILLCAWNH
jgi:hypothetical protein